MQRSILPGACRSLRFLMSAWSSTAACRDIQTSEYRQKAYNELQPHPRTQKPLDIHSSRQVRSLPKRISGSCCCPVSAARLPGHCFWISNSIPSRLWVCPRSACHCLARVQLNAQMIAQNEQHLASHTFTSPGEQPKVMFTL